ncbi:MAG: 5-amino-6-(D-ribitylamino)uracil--L-tyrosine 4-hydroxyphenyl transferase CofH [Methanocorpusculum sp.]|nr:5-amino-6-(D-ribitylamino)uracil--L-tyrosine 4-hydroxyphenyl transferase CofH [Methanocorpusculum sp.]
MTADAKKTDTILSDVLGGARMTEEEAEYLLSLRGADIWKTAAAADTHREKKCGDAVTYVRNMNIHVTNICKNRCGLCAFGRRESDADAFFYDGEVLRERVQKARNEHVSEVCYLSGIHPSFTIESYENIIRMFHEEIPGIHIHGCSPDEILFAAERSGISTKEALIRLKAAGLNSVQGTAAEILDDSVRRVICEKKLSTADWCRIIREAASLGFRSTATIMYGSIETNAQRARHLGIIRGLQDETGVFTEMVPLAFLHKNTPLAKEGLVNHGSFGREDLLMTAVLRLFLDNIDNIQVPWTKIGKKMAAVCLCAGGNDLGGTMFSDPLSRTAGADEEADFFSPEDMDLMCRDLGRKFCERDTLYRLM